MTLCIKDRYYNYDNIGTIDFGKYKKTADSFTEIIYTIAVYMRSGMINTTFEVTEEEWNRAKENLEIAIINNYVFKDLLED